MAGHYQHNNLISQLATYLQTKKHYLINISQVS